MEIQAFSVAEHALTIARSLSSWRSFRPRRASTSGDQSFLGQLGQDIQMPLLEAFLPVLLEPFLLFVSCQASHDFLFISITSPLFSFRISARMPSAMHCSTTRVTAARSVRCGVPENVNTQRLGSRRASERDGRRWTTELAVGRFFVVGSGGKRLQKIREEGKV